MILSFGSQPSPGALTLWPALVAVAAYAAAALAPVDARRRWPYLAWSLGWVAHALTLLVDFGVLDAGPEARARFGFAPVLSGTAWLVLAVHVFESRWMPLPQVRRPLALLGGLTVVLASVFPGEPHAASVPRWAPLHWTLGIASYGLVGAAVLHASMLDAADRQLRLKSGGAGPLGIPLLRLERLTFRFVDVGFVALTLTLLVGVGSTIGPAAAPWRWDHKTVLSLLSWAVLAALLAGRHWWGWRGRRATRWLYAAAALLLLAYVGSRFVFEVVLHRMP
jgi:ABC-type uncharacterized transport system permease subunit